MSDERDILEIANRRRVVEGEVEHERAVLVQGTCLDCDKPAVRHDGRCLAHSRLALDARESKLLAEDILKRNAARYATLHLEGAERAAREGDTRPAEWALLHSGSVQPVMKDAGPGGVTVQIGVMLPLLKEGVE